LFERRGVLAKFWDTAREQAASYGKHVLLIARENGRATQVLVDFEGLVVLREQYAVATSGLVERAWTDDTYTIVLPFDEVFALRRPLRTRMWKSKNADGSNGTPIKAKQ
jgi:hypothetical protein